MKTKISNVFLTFTSVFIFCSFALAQDKPVAVKIHEYDEASEKIEVFTERLNSFMKKLSASPETTDGIVFRQSENPELIASFKSVLAKHPNLKNRVELIQLSPPAFQFEKSPEKTEFWLVPKGADLPYLRIRCALCVCPTISVEGSEFIDEKTSVVTFTAYVSGGTAEVVKFKWEVSGGEIVKGQGTPGIEVIIKDPKVKEIIATIDLIGSVGMCDFCDYKSSFTIKIKK
jgi:hypothetical protein